MVPRNPELQETQPYWDSQAEAFDNEPDHGLRHPSVRAAWCRLLLDSLPDAPAAVLDVGCGTGSLSILMTSLGHEVVGVDYSPAMIARAVAKTQATGYAIPFQIMDAANLAFPKGSFDAIVCRHLLWSFPDPSALLSRWTKLLTPGGRLILIEGYWHTGGGLYAQQCIAALPASVSNNTVRNLSDQPDLWGGQVSDERYVIVAELAG